MLDLSIVIVSYNTKEFLKKCLESISKHFSRNYSLEVIMVDNDSQDGSVEEVQSAKFKAQNESLKLKVIQNKENMGFSKANNIGIKHAKGRYVLFLNSDTEVRENVLDTMVQFMDEHPKAGATTCKVELPNGEIDDACHRGFPTPWNSFCHFAGLGKVFPYSQFFNGYHLGWKDLDTVHEIDSCAGAFMLVRREAGEEVGWWDEDYFFYGEDLDFCFRLKQKEWKIYFVPTVSILHFKGVSSGIKEVSKQVTIADAETRKNITKARFDAMKIFYKKHYKDKYPMLINWFMTQGIEAKKKMFSKKYL